MALLSARVSVSRLLVAAGIAALWGLMPSAQAGSATADSIWDRSNALQRALQAMPADATVTKQNCQTLEIGLDNIRYRCTVWWNDPPASPPASQPTPSATP